MCTRSLAGNSSLWSVEKTLVAKGKNGRDEAGMGHSSNSCKFSVTVLVAVKLKAKS